MRPGGLRGAIALLWGLAVLSGAALAPAAEAGFEFLPGSEGFSAAPLAEGGAPELQAGSHPVALTMSVGFVPASSGPFSEGDLRDLSFELPPGLLENPAALPECSLAAFHTPRVSPWEASLSGESCPDRTQVGTIAVRSSYGGGQTRTFGLFNLTPPPGAPSELAANPYGAPIIFIPKIRQADGEYGLTLETRDVPQLTDVSGLALTIWGTPWSILHNAQRGNCLNEAEPEFGWAKCSVGRPARTDNIPRAYLTMPTACEGPLTFTAHADSWQAPGEVTRVSQAPGLGGCGSLHFEPKPQAQLSNPRASSPSGYIFDINVDTSGVTEPKRLAPTPVRKAVVTLPEGVTINPSVGAGLGVCTPAQYAAETASSPPGAGCPNPSKIGDFTVFSPLFHGPIEGAIFLAAPYDNPSGGLLEIYLVAKSIDRGVLVKVAGEVDADQQSGSLTAIFDRLPQLPYSQLEIHFREGQRSPLATPASCGPISTAAKLTPWRNAAQVEPFSLPAQISAGAGGVACPQGLAPFSPEAKGGMLNSRAGAYTPFYLHLARSVTEQEIVSYSATLPPGLLGKITGVPYCSDAAIEAARGKTGVDELEHPSCPVASQIGRTTAGYGVGTALTYAPGALYLAGPYRGSSLSVVAIDSALVGPFDLGTVIVRSAIRIDPITTQASIDATGTDPIPHIVKGIPIHLRDVRVYVDRPDFTVNPTSCEPSPIASELNGAGRRYADISDDTLALAPSPFQAFDCSSLGFRPRVALKLKGGRKRGKHPALRVIVRPRRGNANIAFASVTLPPALFLDQGRIKTICTRAQFAAHECPAGSIYGHVRAYTPLLAAPMEGPAYLRSSDSALPDLVFALHGQGIEVDLAGRIDSYKEGLRGTFPALPDAPVSKFELRLRGGKRGVLVSSAKDLCADPQLGASRFVGHANRGWASHPPLELDCGKRRRDGGRGQHRHRGAKGA